MVNIKKIGTPGSFYFLIPRKLLEKIGLSEGDEFLCYESGGAIYYQSKKALSRDGAMLGPHESPLQASLEAPDTPKEAS